MPNKEPMSGLESLTPAHYELVATFSRRWLALEIRLPKLCALASIHPGDSAPLQSHCKTIVKLFRTRLPRPSSEPRW
jgi:hypothetical protein